MSANAIPARPTVTLVAPLVAPVVDYEPPAFGGPPIPPSPYPRPRCAASVRPARPLPEAEARVRAATTLAAATFADSALRRVLEVIDRRRPPAQIRPLLATGLADSLPRRAVGTGTAQLRRVVAQICDDNGMAAEVAASYARGERVGAIACRVEKRSTPTGQRWQLVALHIG